MDHCNGVGYRRSGFHYCEIRALTSRNGLSRRWGGVLPVPSRDTHSRVENAGWRYPNTLPHPTTNADAMAVRTTVVDLRVQMDALGARIIRWIVSSILASSGLAFAIAK